MLRVEHILVAGIPHKTCTTCKHVKPLVNFGTHRTRWDGLLSVCKACTSVYMRASYKRGDSELRKQKRRRYYYLNGGREVSLNYSREYKKTHDKELRAKAKEYGASPEGRAAHMLRRYGLSAFEYQKILGVQEGSCGFCRGAFKKTPHVDHCHTTGFVRGVLCNGCNVGLGFLEKHGIDHPYLQDPPAYKVGMFKRSK